MREETKYIVIHCSQTRPSQNIGAKDIDRWHRANGWLKIGYGKVIKRDGTIEQGRGDDDVQAHVKGYNHCSYGLCLVGGALEEDWKKPEDNFTAEQWEALKKELENINLISKFGFCALIVFIFFLSALLNAPLVSITNCEF